jgi:DNA-binding transcriptional regulator GbsR (MarR family)
MTEITEGTGMDLTPVMERFIVHWGEMGTRWGVNRSVSQIHALLYLSPQPLTAEEISDTLAIARSNVSTSLKELQAWGLVQLVHVLGDRRDHFDARKDVWEMLTLIVEERKRREIDPTVSVLRQCVLDAADDRKTEPEVRVRLQQMLDFMELTGHWYTELKQLPKPTLVRLMKLGAKVAKMIGG